MTVFKPPAIIRFCYRYTMIVILIVIPAMIAIETILTALEMNGAPILFVMVNIMLSMAGTVLIHIVFWEKFFATLTFTNREIIWKCPFRKTKVMDLETCVEIGAYLENADNGIPAPQIYFSDHPYPKRNMNKHGVIKSSQHLIKFWYSEELCTFLLENYSSKKTGCLSAYRQQAKRKRK